MINTNNKVGYYTGDLAKQEGVPHFTIEEVVILNPQDSGSHPVISPTYEVTYTNTEFAFLFDEEGEGPVISRLPDSEGYYVTRSNKFKIKLKFHGDE